MRRLASGVLERGCSRGRAFALWVAGLAGACAPAAEAEGRNAGECSDAADNDGDGAFDCDDADCDGSPDCDGEAEADADSDADTDSDSDSDADDGFAYLGTRHFGGEARGQRCDDDVVDRGLLLTEGPEWEYLLSRCPSCDAFYKNVIDPPVICTSYTLRTPDYRGVIVEGGQAWVYVLQGEGGTPGLEEGSDSSATVEGNTVSYGYSFAIGSTDVTASGTMDFDTLPGG